MLNGQTAQMKLIMLN